MSESRWAKVKDSTVPVLLGTLIVALFYTTASTHGRMADMENRLGERINGLVDQTHEVDKSLSARISEVDNNLSARINELDRNLSNRINEVEKSLSDRLTRLETLMEIHLEALSTQAASGEIR